MGRRNDHSREELRTLALEAAERIVAENGAKGLTARKVAAAIGYTVGTLYLVFENLDDLVLHVNGRTLQELDRQMKVVHTRCADPRICLFELGHTYVRFATEHQHRWSLVFDYHRSDPAQQLPDWYQDHVTSLFKRVEEPLQRLLPEAPQRDLFVAARTLWGGIHGICSLALAGKWDVVGVASVESMVDFMMKNFLSGLTRS